jgi:hypothetical protein
MDLLRYCSASKLRNAHACHPHVYHTFSLQLQVTRVGLQHTKCGQNYNHLFHSQTTHAFIMSSVKSILAFKGLWKIRKLTRIQNAHSIYRRATQRRTLKIFVFNVRILPPNGRSKLLVRLKAPSPIKTFAGRVHLYRVTHSLAHC